MRFIRAILIATLIGLAFTLMGITKQRSSPRRTPTPTPRTLTSASPTPTSVSGYSVFLQKINPRTLTLISNFTEAKTSSELMESHRCSYGANGGYYTTANIPLGLFITEGKQIGATTISTAANAFLTKNTDGTLELRQTPPPTDGIAFALQAGPYLLPDVTAKIAADEHARRVLIAHTKQDDWYFLTIIHPENAYDGPLLSSVPGILAKLPQEISEALNLDGGTASAFYNEDGARFGELTMVGSFFCGK